MQHRIKESLKDNVLLSLLLFSILEFRSLLWLFTNKTIISSSSILNMAELVGTAIVSHDFDMVYKQTNHI